MMLPLDVIKEIAPTGTLRVAINFGNPVLAQPDPLTGKPLGVSVDLAREVASRLGVLLELIPYDSAGKVFSAVETAAWDMAFMAIDPVRAEKLAFTAPYVIIEGTYLVRTDSPLQLAADLDKDGIRIAVGKGAAYDLYLSRALNHATLLRAATSAAAIDLFVEQSLDAAAGVRQPLQAYAARHSGFRVLEDSFTAIRQAVTVPKGNAAAHAWLTAFIDEMKTSGFVAAGLQRSGQTGASVAP